MSDNDPQLDWWENYSNIVTLVQYLAEQGYDSDEVAYAVSKPWKFEDEFQNALVALAEGADR